MELLVVCCRHESCQFTKMDIHTGLSGSEAQEVERLICNLYRELSHQIDFDEVLPRLVILGEQSAGKSSLIARIIKCDILPINAGISTRVITRITVIPSKEGDFFEMENDGLRLYNESEVRSRIQADMQRICCVENTGISSSVIGVTVYRRDSMFIQLFDLPGYVCISSRIHTTDVVGKITTLLEKLRSRENTMLIAVIPATTPIVTSNALSICLQNNKAGDRLLVVLTKGDLLRDFTEIVPNLENRQIDLVNRFTSKCCEVSTEFGYFLVSDMIPKQFNKEEDYFSTFPELKDVLHRIGFSKLRIFLHDLLISRVIAKIPNIERQIIDEVHEVTTFIDTLPISISNPRDVVVKLSIALRNKIYTEFFGYEKFMPSQFSFENGTFGAYFSKDLRFWLTQKLLEIPGRVDKLYDRQLTLYKRNAVGVRIGFRDGDPSRTTDVMIESLVGKLLMENEAVVAEYIDEFRRPFRKCIIGFIDDVYVDQPKLRRAVSFHVTQYIADLLKDLKQRATETYKSYEMRRDCLIDLDEHEYSRMLKEVTNLLVQSGRLRFNGSKYFRNQFCELYLMEFHIHDSIDSTGKLLAKLDTSRINVHLTNDTIILEHVEPDTFLYKKERKIILEFDDDIYISTWYNGFTSSKKMNERSEEAQIDDTQLSNVRKLTKCILYKLLRDFSIEIQQLVAYEVIMKFSIYTDMHLLAAILDDQNYKNLVIQIDNNTPELLRKKTSLKRLQDCLTIVEEIKSYEECITKDKR